MPVQMALNVDDRQFAPFDELVRRLRRPNRFQLRGIEQAVRRGFSNNFSRQSVGGGAVWPALRPRTQAERRRQGFNPDTPILVRSGVYRRSWVTVGGWVMIDYQTGGWVFHVSSDHRYAFAHELGQRSRNLPRRAVRYLDSSDMRSVANAVEFWVDGLIQSIFS